MMFLICNPVFVNLSSPEIGLTNIQQFTSLPFE